MSGDADRGASEGDGTLAPFFAAAREHRSSCNAVAGAARPLPREICSGCLDRGLVGRGLGRGEIFSYNVMHRYIYLRDRGAVAAKPPGSR
jgi:hypothetical protein